MSLFKRQVLHEIDSVFLNMDEFGEVHTIDGAPVVCVLDSSKLDPSNAPGVYVSEFRLHLAKGSLPAVPSVGSYIQVDNERAWVTHVADNVGMLTVHCARAVD